MTVAEPDDRTESNASAEMLDRHEKLTVGVIVERRKAKSAWADYVWQPIEALTILPPLAPWTVMRDGDGVTRYFAGPFTMELHPKETISYRANLISEKPSIYVVLRADSTAPQGWRLELVTPSPADAEAYMEGGADIVDKVPMPGEVGAWLSAYVDTFHVEEEFRKRRRGRDKPSGRRIT